MNPEILGTLKQELTKIVGMLALIEIGIRTDDPDDNDIYWLQESKAELVGLIKGLEIILDNQPTTKEIHHNEAI